MYFIYPETANVRLEDMDQLFGDATTAMPTPQQHAEVEALMSASRSPVPSLDIQRPGTFTADHAIPGLNINPPHGHDGSSADQSHGHDGEGSGGWISRMTNRFKGEKGSDSGSYRQVGQDDS